MSPFSQRWLAFTLAYITGIVGLFAAYRFGGSEHADLVMLGALLPTIFLTYVPIYVVVAGLDSVVGSGTGGSPISDIAFVVGLTLTALVNVGLLRLVLALAKSCRLWRRSVTTA